MVRTMNSGSVSPDPPKGHKNLDNCVRDETRAIHSVPHMQQGVSSREKTAFSFQTTAPSLRWPFQLRAPHLDHRRARPRSDAREHQYIDPDCSGPRSNDLARRSADANAEPLLREKPRCSPREAFPVAPPPRRCSETAPHAPVSSPFGASQARPVERVRRVTPPRARPARQSARQPQVRDPSTPRGSNLFRSARAKYSSPQALPRTSGYRRWIDPRDGACDRSTFAFAASRLSPPSDSAVPRPNRPSPRAIRRLHLADFEIKRDASTRRRGVRGR